MNYNCVRRVIDVKHEHFEWSTKIIMIELFVADTMQPNGSSRRYHEIERRASRPPSSEWRGQSPWRNPLLAHERHPHESARGVRLELQQVANLIGSQFIGYLCHRIS